MPPYLKSLACSGPDIWLPRVTWGRPKRSGQIKTYRIVLPTNLIKYHPLPTKYVPFVGI